MNLPNQIKNDFEINQLSDRENLKTDNEHNSTYLINEYSKWLKYSYLKKIKNNFYQKEFLNIAKHLHEKGMNEDDLINLAVLENDVLQKYNLSFYTKKVCIINKLNDLSEILKHFQKHKEFYSLPLSNIDVHFELEKLCQNNLSNNSLLKWDKLPQEKEHEENHQLDEAFFELSVRSKNICIFNGLNSKQKILDYFLEHQSFKNFRNCGERTNQELIKYCILGLNNCQEKNIKKDEFNKVFILTTKDLKVIRYSEKSFAIIGKTKKYKDEFKSFGGRFNPFLKINEERICGWIFKLKKLDDIMTLLKKI